MARKTKKVTQTEQQALIKEGFGCGEGATYKPWILTGSFSSRGRGNRIPDHRNGRVHHFLSDLEADYYYVVAWADAVIDIREQFPLLPISDTEQIAQALGYCHPKCIGGRLNEIMTTDFVLTVKDATGIHLEARYVKYEKDLQSQRTCEKLEIEKQYWFQHNIPFKVVTENSFNRCKAKNICMLLGHYDIATVGVQSERMQEAAIDLLLNLLDGQYLSLA